MVPLHTTTTRQSANPPPTHPGGGIGPARVPQILGASGWLVSNKMSTEGSLETGGDANKDIQSERETSFVFVRLRGRLADSGCRRAGGGQRPSQPPGGTLSGDVKLPRSPVSARCGAHGAVVHTNADTRGMFRSHRFLSECVHTVTV